MLIDTLMIAIEGLSEGLEIQGNLEVPQSKPDPAVKGSTESLEFHVEALLLGTV